MKCRHKDPQKIRRTSPPSRGAWIEIADYGHFANRWCVAPLAGGVD